jgi:hypothetical protein
MNQIHCHPYTGQTRTFECQLCQEEVKLKTYNVVIPLVEPEAGCRVAVPWTIFVFLGCDGLDN